MRRLVRTALLAASVIGLGGCVFAVGTSDNDDGRRIKALETRLARAEKALGIQDEAKQ